MTAINARLTVFVCFLIAALEGYDIQAFGVAAPRLAPELGLGAAQLGWAGSAAMIGLVIGAFAGGWLADRIGRKPVLAGSVAIFGVFSLVTAAAPGFEALFWARLATGLGFGGAMPNLIAVATEISRPERRAATVTAMFCGMPVGGAIAALTAQLGGEALDWRWVFIAGGLAPLALVPVILRFLPETRPQVDPDVPRPAARALLDEGRAGPSLAIWGVFMLTLVILYLALNWLPTLVIQSGHPPALGASAAMVFNLSGVVGALILGPLTDRYGWRWPLTAAYLALAAVMAGMAIAASPGSILALSGAAGFLVMGAQFSLYAVAPGLYPPALRGLGSGVAVGVGRFGSIAGPLVAGELRAAGASPGEVFGAMTPVALVSGVLVLALAAGVARQRAREGGSG
jgi:AAHS family 3-hydroxyphenylpropionic acid transporter